MAEQFDEYLDAMRNPPPPPPETEPAAPADDFLETMRNPVKGFLSSSAKEQKPWSEVEPVLRERSPELNPDELRQGYQLDAARTKFKGGYETTIEYMGRRIVPFGSAAFEFGESQRYRLAKERFNKGEATEKDIDDIAGYERLQEIDRERSTRDAVISNVLRAPAMVGEAMAGASLFRGAGQVGKAGLGATAPSVFTKAGARAAVRAAPGEVGRGVLRTPAIPSVYLAQASKRAEENGGDWWEGKNLGVAMGYGAVQTAVLGHSLKLGSLAGGGRAGQAAVGGGAGLLEQQAGDVFVSAVDETLNDAWQTKTRYGVIGNLARGEYDQALKASASQAITFGAFAGLNKRPAGPMYDAYAKAVDDLGNRGTGREAIDQYLHQLGGRLDTAMRAKPDLTAGEAKAIFEGMKAGPAKDYALALADTLPDVGMNAGRTERRGQEAAVSRAVKQQREENLEREYENFQTVEDVAGRIEQERANVDSVDGLIDLLDWSLVRDAADLAVDPAAPPKLVGGDVAKLYARLPVGKDLDMRTLGKLSAVELRRLQDAGAIEITPERKIRRAEGWKPPEKAPSLSETPTLQPTPPESSVNAPGATRPADAPTAPRAGDRAAGESWEIGTAKERGAVAAEAFQAVKAGQKATYVDMDVDNMAGLAKELGDDGAKGYVREMVGIMREELAKVGARVEVFRHAGDPKGDEHSAVVFGADRAAVNAALKAAAERLDDLAAREGVRHLPHAKGGRKPGVGLSAFAEEFKPGADPRNVFAEAEAGTETVKSRRLVEDEPPTVGSSEPAAPPPNPRVERLRAGARQRPDVKAKPPVDTSKIQYTDPTAIKSHDQLETERLAAVAKRLEEERAAERVRRGLPAEPEPAPEPTRPKFSSKHLNKLRDKLKTMGVLLRAQKAAESVPDPGPWKPTPKTPQQLSDELRERVRIARGGNAHPKLSDAMLASGIEPPKPPAKKGGKADIPEPNRPALEQIAARSIPRDQLSGEYQNMLKSTDLFDYGYSISHWIKPGVKESEVIEYNPRTPAGTENEGLPRMTATSFEEQKAVHEALGVPVSGPGQPSPTNKRPAPKAGSRRAAAQESKDRPLPQSEPAPAPKAGAAPPLKRTAWQEEQYQKRLLRDAEAAREAARKKAEWLEKRKGNLKQNRETRTVGAQIRKDGGLNKEKFIKTYGKGEYETIMEQVKAGDIPDPFKDADGRPGRQVIEDMLTGSGYREQFTRINNEGHTELDVDGLLEAIKGKKPFADAIADTAAGRKAIELAEEKYYREVEEADKAERAHLNQLRERYVRLRDEAAAELERAFPSAGRGGRDRPTFAKGFDDRKAVVDEYEQNIADVDAKLAKLGPTEYKPPEGDIWEELGEGRGNDRLGVTAPIPVIDAFARSLKSVGAAVRKWLSSAGDLPKADFLEKTRHDGRIAAFAQDVKNTEADLRRAVGGDYSKLSEAQIQLLDDALRGDRAAMAKVPPAVQPVILDMRRQVDSLSRALIQSGAIQGKMAVTVDANLGAYLHRRYRVFDDPNWAAKVEPAVKNRFKSWLSAELAKQGVNDPDRVEAMTKALLADGTAAENPIAYLSRSKLGSKDLSVLARRKDVPPELRALWGEYRDPLVNYVNSVHRMGHLLSNHRFLENVRQAGQGKHFFTEEQLGDFQRLFPDEKPVKVAPEGSETMGPLAGMYTTLPIKKAYEAVYAKEQLPGWLRGYMRIMAIPKYGKTILSPVTHARNFLGNAGFALSNGHFRAANALTALKAVRDDTAAGRAYYRKLLELGLADDSVQANEFKSTVNDVLKQREMMDLSMMMNASVERRLVRGAHWTLDKAEAAYRAEDVLWKVYGFENEKSRYAEAFPGWSPAQVEARAAQIVRDTYPTYSLVPAAVKGLRRFPVVAPFASFPSEVVRTTYHTVRLAVSEIKDPATRAIGFTRLAGMGMAATLTAGLAAATRAMFGVDQDDEDAMRRFLPAWSKDHPLLHLGRDSNGNRQYVDLGYTDPHSFLAEPVYAAMRSDDPEQAALQAGLAVGKPFFGEELLAERVLDIARNEKREGGDVYNPQLSRRDKIVEGGGHLAGAATPGVWSWGRRLVMGLAGQKEQRTGREYEPVAEAAAGATGQRVTPLDVGKALEYKARTFQTGRTEAARIETEMARSRGLVSDAELLQAREKSEVARRRLFEELRKDVVAAQELGLGRDEVVKILRRGGVSQSDSRLILENSYRPRRSVPVPGPDSAERTRRLEVLRAGARSAAPAPR